MASRNQYELKEQIAYCDWFQFQYPEYWPDLIHIPNGANLNKIRLTNPKTGKTIYSGAQQWKQLKKAGCKNGVSDIFHSIPIGIYHGFWMEYKAARPNNAPITDDQQKWVDRKLSQGFYACVAVGFEEAKHHTENYFGKK